MLFLSCFAIANNYVRCALALYLVWVVFDRSPSNGGYECFWRLGLTNWLRRRWWWSSQSRYYPLHLHKTCKLSAEEGPFLFCNHPHGVIGVGTMACFGANANRFEELFPELREKRLHLLGLNRIFQIPLFREWVLMHGHATPGRKTMKRLLGHGHHLALNIGGAKEALDAHPGSFRLVLRHRRGFVRVAMESGARLVPVLHFGENELYDQVDNAPGTLVRSIQDRL